MLSLTPIALAAALAAGIHEPPVVEVEETVTTVVPPNNGAGPLWCYGAPLLARRGEDVYASVMETGKDVPPLCNTRWQLFHRGSEGWKVLRQGEKFVEREPCPLVTMGGDLFLSVNPSLKPPGAQYEACDPHLVRFRRERPNEPGAAERPVWPPGVRFTDHSYRGLAADTGSGAILLLNIHAQTGHQIWSYRDGNSAWSRQGEIAFPIRSCYPQVALQGGAAHVLAIGDVVEPNEEWRQYKREKTGAAWDYVFRRLFYAHSPDIRRAEVAPPVEVENVEKTAGYIRNLDLWIDPTGTAHVLYLKQSIQSALMRDRFFPGQPIRHSLEWCVIREGRILSRDTLVAGSEGEAGEIPGNARFHATVDGRLFLIYAARVRDSGGANRSENRLLQILPLSGERKPVVLPFKVPFTTFFTATERGGSAPGPVLDLFGVGREGTILRYARVRLPAKR